MMFSKKIAGLGLLLLALAFLLTTPCLAQEPPEKPAAPPEETPPEEPVSPPADRPELTVTATICTTVEDREPVGAGEVFPATVEKLYCHTLIEGAEEPITITHVWYHGEENMAEVFLDVKSVRWRTWSSKKIVQSWTGEWRVDILGPEGNALTSISFQVQ